MANCPHSEFRKGTRVVVIFKNGNKHISQYIGKNSGSVVLKSGRIELRKVRSISIFRNQTSG